MHQPVLLSEMLEALDLAAGKQIVDCTFGAGGYSQAILQTAGVRVLALDRDPSVRETARKLEKKHDGRFSFFAGRFSELETALKARGWQQVDGIVLDVGVSSMQIDQGERGFSFLRDGPLDMRMSQSGISAADAVNQLSEQDLRSIFRIYGEEKRARRAAAAIVAYRQEQAFSTTRQLAELMERVLGPKKGRIHPATKIFQALRIFVNDELGELAKLLVVAERVLRPAGRLVIIAFHSLEDRLVKKFLRARAEAPSTGSRFSPMAEIAEFCPGFTLVQRNAIVPSKTETANNPRARSARLRWAVRTDAAPMEAVPQLAPVPGLTALECRS